LFTSLGKGSGGVKGGGRKRGNNRGEKGRVMRDGRSNAGKVPLEATIPYHTL